MCSSFDMIAWMFSCTRQFFMCPCIKLGCCTHGVERVLSSAARAPLCPQMAGCGFSSVRTRIRWCFTCLACCVNHRDTPVPTEDTTSLQPSSSRLQVANLCEDGRAHTIHLFVLKHIGLDVFLLARTNALLSMRNLPERHKHFSVARWHVGGEFTMGGKMLQTW